MGENIITAIKRRIELIKGGLTIKDKIVIFLFIVVSVLYYPFDKKLKRRNFLFSDVITRNKDGIFFCKKHTSQIWGIDTFKEPRSRKYFELIKGGTFIDVGANVGMYSVRVANRLKNKGMVVSIEPESENFEALLKNIEVNQLKNIIPINAACFSKNTPLKLYIAKFPGQHSLYGKGEYIKTKARKLDDILKEHKIKDVRLIKIDVEGAEVEVIKGANKTISKYKPLIIFESWDKEHFGKMKAILRREGYNIKKISNQDYFANIPRSLKAKTHPIDF